MLLNFDHSDTSENKLAATKHRSLKALLGVGGLAAVIAIGSTLAANINLNSGSSVEFGQGILNTTACDNEISITPETSFANSNEGGGYVITSINLSGIDSSSDHCASKDFIIRAYYKNDSNPQNIIDSVNEIIVRDNGRGFAVDSIDGLVLISSNNSSFSLTLSPTHELMDSAELDKLTIESRDHIYSVGSEGPGGGVVFYISDSNFACGPNLNLQCNALEYPPTGIIGTSIARWAPIASATTEVGEGARSTAIGGGYKNSISIVHQYTEVDGQDQTTYQAGVARLYDGGELSDWYMPSRDELYELYSFTRSNNLSAPMAYGNSSSEVSATSNWGIYFPVAGQVPTQTGTKRDTNPSVPIRAFMTAVGN